MYITASYRERSLYYWAREYSAAIGVGDDYPELPCTIVLSILGFKLFDCEDCHSEFRLLEVTRHELLTNKVCLHYFELKKVPEIVGTEDGLMLWLNLFNAETEEQLARLSKMGGSVMKQAIEAYHQITATDSFRELERQRHYSEFNRKMSMGYARREGIEIGAEMEREKWQGVVAEKDALVAQQAAIATEKDALVAEKDALIAKLQAQLAEANNAENNQPLTEKIENEESTFV